MPDTTPTTDRNGVAGLLAHHADVLAARWRESSGRGAWVAASTLDSHAAELTADEETPFVRELLDSILAFEADPARLVCGTTDEQPVTAPAGTELRDRLTGALDECRTMIPASQADVVLSVLRKAGVLPASTDRAAEGEQDAPINWRAIVQQRERELKRSGDRTETHRLALSDALGLGTGAPWDAIRDRAAELRAEVERLRTNRTTVLREAADVAHGEASRLYDDMGQKAAAGARMVGARLERMADEAQQSECTSAPCLHPADCRNGCRAAADELSREAQQPETEAHR